MKLNKILLVLQFNQSQWLKPYVKCNAQKRIETEKHGDKDGKALHKLMINVVYGKARENLRKRIHVKLVSNEKDYLKWTLKPSYKSQKYLKLI